MNEEEDKRVIILDSLINKVVNMKESLSFEEQNLLLGMAKGMLDSLKNFERKEEKNNE